jgi:aryl-phospho-beta-D-glucosidase BglC (GH1 family)
MKRNNHLLYVIIATILLASPVITFGQVTPEEAVAQMRRGINMGNTLEPPHEGDWAPKAKEYYFDMYHDAGFDVVRVPVRWDEHTSYSSPYTIDEAWMDRVEQIVDWALERDLYVVINAHHEDWIKENYEDKNLRDRFDSIWSQVAVTMQNKSEKLLFEILNEPTTQKKGLTIEQNNKLHQRALNIIRRTNPTRIVIFQGHNWGGSNELLQAAIPDDPYLLGSFHSYDPYVFGLEGKGTWGSANDYKTLEDKFKSVSNWSEENNIPVFLGEFGSLRECHYNSRMRHYQAYVELSLKYGFTACAWDDGGNFKILERNDRKWDEVKDILIYGSMESPNNIQAFVHQDSIVRVAWNNRTENYDSIKIERKTTGGTYQKYIMLEKGTTYFNDTKPEMDKTYHYRIILTHNDETKKPVYAPPIKVYFPKWEVPERVPFHGEAMPVPGTIEAEDFDMGGNGYTYYDKTDGNQGGDYRPDEDADIYNLNGINYIGGIISDEWYEYSVQVEETNDYNIEIYTTSLVGGGTYKISVGNTESEVLKAPKTADWFSPKSNTTNMQLTQGLNIVRFTAVDASSKFNLDKMVFSSTNSSHKVAGLNNLAFKAVPHYHQSEIIILVENENLEKVNIYNASGVLINSFTNKNKLNSFTIDTPANGVYLVEGINGKKKSVQKIVY